MNLSGWFFLINVVPYLGGLVLLIMAALASNPMGARYDYAGYPLTSYPVVPGDPQG